eukprot:scaffold5786_cov129-Isochrysis_galbana.AAC.1
MRLALAAWYGIRFRPALPPASDVPTSVRTAARVALRGWRMWLPIATGFGRRDGPLSIGPPGYCNSRPAVKRTTICVERSRQHSRRPAGRAPACSLASLVADESADTPIRVAAPPTRYSTETGSCINIAEATTTMARLS